MGHRADFLTVLGSFVFLYPALMSVLWVVGGLHFWWRRERGGGQAAGWPAGAVAAWPAVTVLVPCRNEEALVARTCCRLAALDYPDLRVLFIDDASTDRTVAVLRPYLREHPSFHLLRLRTNLGKAAALNAGLALVRTPLTLVIDADTLLAEDAVRYLAEPFLRKPRLGAVTGNPLPLNRGGLLGSLQAAEFSSIIGLIRRCQRVWGRVLTVSGCATMYLTEALRRVGGFSPSTATEDIDVTWRLQRACYEVWFEPRAVALIQVPATAHEYLRQRRRWALGGWHLLRGHASVFRSWRWRRLWPVYLEFLLSYLWSFCLVGLTLLWAVGALSGRPLPGTSPLPAWPGAVLSVVCVTQMVVAGLINRPYDPGLRATLFWVPWYPLFFFATGAVLAVWTARAGLVRPLTGAGLWLSRREPEESGEGGVKTS